MKKASRISVISTQFVVRLVNASFLWLLFSISVAQAQYTVSVAQTAPPAGTVVGVDTIVSYDVTWTGGSIPPQLILSPSSALTFLGIDTTAGIWTCGASAPIVCLPSLSPSPTRLRARFRMPATVPGFIPNDLGSPSRANAQVTASPATNCDLSGAGCQGAGASGSATTIYTVETDYALNAPATLASNQGAFDLVISVQNAGPNLRYQGASVNITLPSGMSYLSVSGDADWSCAGLAPSVNCSRVDGADQGLETFTVRLNGTSSGAILSRVSSATPDINSSNNQRTTAVTINPPPGVDASLSASAPTSGLSNSNANVRFVVTTPASLIGAQNVSLTISQVSETGATINSVAGPPDFNCSVNPNGLGVTCFNTDGFGAGASVRNIDVGIRLPSVNPDSTTTLVFFGQLITANDTNPANNEAQVSIEVRGNTSARLAVSKTASTNQVAAGTEFDFNLAVSNSGTINATQVELVDVVPDALRIVNVNADLDLACSINAQIVRCLTPSMTPGQNLRATIRVQAPSAAGEITNRASASASNVLTPVSASAIVAVGAPSNVDLAIDKSDTQDPVALNGSFSYTLVVSNRSAGVAQQVSLTDTLPAGVRLVSVSGAGWSCSGTTTVQCSRPELASNQSSSVTINVQAVSAGLLSNTASVSSSAIDADATNNRDTETTQVNAPGADLAITGPAAVSLTSGATASADFSVRNLGPEQAGNTRVQITATGAASLVSTSIANCAAPVNNSANCSLGALSNGTTQNFTVQLRGTSVGNGEVVVSLSADTVDGNATNNTTRTAVRVTQLPGVDLGVTLRDSVDPVALNAEFDYVATISNVGPDTAEAVVASFTLAGGLTLRSTVGASCTPALVCTLTSSIAAGQSATVTLRVAATGEVGRVETSVSVSSATRETSPGNNSATEATTISANSTDVIGSIIVPQLTDRFALDAAPAVSELCARPTADLAAQCEAIIDAALDRNVAALEQGLRALYPEEVLAERLALVQQSELQFNNIDARLNELRNGSRGLSYSGLNLKLGGYQIPLQLIGLLRQDEQEPEIGDSGELISRWGFFINGTLSQGEQKLGRDRRGIAADFDTTNINAGVDYRLNARAVIGAALGFSKFESDLTDQGGSENRTTTISGYGSYYVSNRLYVDSRLSFGRSDFDFVRRIRFATFDRTAIGSTDADQLAFSVGAGYHLEKGGWSFTPNANVRVFRSTIDAFTESGAGDNNIAFDEQDVNSTQLTFGLSLSRAISFSRGVFVPQFDLSFTRESENDDFGVGARFVNVATQRGFTVVADESDRSFGNAGIGFVYVGANGRQAYLTYRSLLGNESLERDSINLGARFEF